MLSISNVKKLPPRPDFHEKSLLLTWDVLKDGIKINDISMEFSPNEPIRAQVGFIARMFCVHSDKVSQFDSQATLEALFYSGVLEVLEE